MREMRAVDEVVVVSSRAARVELVAATNRFMDWSRRSSEGLEGVGGGVVVSCGDFSDAMFHWF